MYLTASLGQDQDVSTSMQGRFQLNSTKILSSTWQQAPDIGNRLRQQNFEDTKAKKRKKRRETAELQRNQLEKRENYVQNVMSRPSEKIIPQNHSTYTNRSVVMIGRLFKG